MVIKISEWQVGKASHNGCRKRRYSIDAARATWYARYRQSRFSKRFG